MKHVIGALVAIALCVMSAPVWSAIELRGLDEIDGDLDVLIEDIGTGKTDYAADLAGLMGEVYAACSQMRDTSAATPAGACGSRLDSDCVAQRLSKLTAAMRRADTVEAMTAYAQVLANLPPGWASGDLAGDQAFLYDLVVNDQRLDDVTRPVFDRALMNSSGLFYDAFYGRGRTMDYIDGKIAITDVVIESYPDSRFVFYALLLKARSLQERALIGYFTAEDPSPPAWPLSDQAQQDLMASNEVYRLVYEQIEIVNDERWPQFRSDILLLMATNDILLDNMNDATTRLEEMIAANAEPAPLDQVFVNKFLPVYFCNPRAEVSPEYHEQIDQYFNPIQFASYTLELLACRDEIDLGSLVLALNEFQNADYRVFLASFQKPADATTFLNRLQSKLDKPDNAPLVDKILTPPEGGLCNVPPYVLTANGPGMTEPSGGGWIGVYYGGGLTHEQGLEMLRLFRDIGVPGYRDAYLWRPQVNN